MRKPFPRRPAQADVDRNAGGGGVSAGTPRQPERRGRSRKGTHCRKTHWFLFGLAMGGLMVFWMASSQPNLLNTTDGSGRRLIDGGGPSKRPRHFGWFKAGDLVRRMEEGRRRFDLQRSEQRHGVRPPRLAIVVGSMSKDSQSLMLLTLGKSLREQGYKLTVFAFDDGEARPLWENIDCDVSILSSAIFVDWTCYEGILLSSLEAKRVVSSLMQDPFSSIPLIWLIQEDSLGKRLPSYVASSQHDLITDWKSAFSRADTVVFPDFTLPMIYSLLDTGNFYVITGSPADMWAAKRYSASHSRHYLRENYGFHEEDLVVTIIESHFFNEDLPLGYASSMLTSQIAKVTRIKDLGSTLKFVFLCGNMTGSFDSDFEELASRLGVPTGAIKHYSLDGDVNGVIMMSDIVVYGSFEEEQNFPALVVRAMAFEIPVVVPNFTVITKHVTDKIHGLVFHPHDVDTLASCFSHLIEDKKLSRLAHSIAYEGRSLAENLLVTDFLIDFARLLESIVQFPSDSFFPEYILPNKHMMWAWNLFDNENDPKSGFKQGAVLHDRTTMQRCSIVDILEEKLSQSGSPIINESTSLDFPTQLDWDDLNEMEIAEDYERQEMEEKGRKEIWGLGRMYTAMPKSQKKLKFEVNERDEGELERIGQALCIYEIYDGQGAWPFLHHGSRYRGITLSRRARRPRSDDVDAVTRLPILNESYYRDLLCEFGAMLSIANRVDGVHKVPWIGFQSWRASGRQVALSAKAEEVLDNEIQKTRKGDVIYYWALMEINYKDMDGNLNPNFWLICDIMNAGKCRTAFESAFRSMYGIPAHLPALPPMPVDDDHWSALHSWVMPTNSFLEFIMFSRIFVDSLHSLILTSNANFSSCFLGSSQLEKRHCYCRLLEVLVNVWAYHSARKMIYLDPHSGDIKEQHPFKQRLMWSKYFDRSLLKRMDEDFAEEADDNMHPTDTWLWPLTGEVHWQGILDREREERYRKKMDKKRRIKEKLLERHKHGYKQKSLGNP
ncbi:hypothetical protein HPP92_022255 [Vanilla planifolia]|uniref:Glycosyl transferase family 1 domain-containing protein n=1 Tax=Vanilla planifolia TaxID=51239 RepID=A0A835UEY0_VANPL|nr:hypothetical protein HPP92_022255 [Vanilla planifolia]